MGSQHTPGPWRIEEYKGNVTILHNFHGEDQLIAENVANDHNARLIAAAPDMERDLQMVLTDIVTLIPHLSGMYRSNMEGVAKLIKGTLSKIEGKVGPS